MTTLAAKAKEALEGATPGPWALIDHGAFEVVDAEGFEIVWLVDGKNARLIAAAPDLAKDRIRLEAENATLRAEVEKLRKAVAVAASYIETFIEDGCPVCGGDCSSSAVLPGYCPMESANRDLIAARAALGEGGE